MRISCIQSWLFSLFIAIFVFTCCNETQSLFAEEQASNARSPSKSGDVAKSVSKKTNAKRRTRGVIDKSGNIILPHPSNFDVPTPRGNAFFPNNNASGESKEFQKKVAKILDHLCASNQARLEHFAWVSTNDIVLKNDSELIGWDGVILEAEEWSSNGWTAKVRVRPRLSRVGRADVVDYVDETYRYQNGRLILVDTDAGRPDPKKKRLISVF